MKKSQPGIETAISFICTKVKYPDVHDWIKLRRVLQFPSQNIGDDRVIGDDNIYESLTYVDASYATHDE